jgi:hypothetical protein
MKRGSAFSIDKTGIEVGSKYCQLRLFNDFHVSIRHHNWFQSMQNKRTHGDILEIFWFIQPTKLPVVFITSIEVDWISSAFWWASMMHWRNIGNQADMLKLSRLWIFKMEVESPLPFQWHNTRSVHRAIINDWIHQLDIQLHKRADTM